MIPVSDWAVIAALTVACAVAALIVGLLLMRLLRNRSVLALLLVTSCSAVATVTGAVLVTTKAMFLSGHDSRVVLVGVALSIISAVGVALVLASTVRGAARSLAVAAVQVGDETYHAAGVVPTTRAADCRHRLERRAPAADRGARGRAGNREQPPSACRRHEPRPAHTPRRDARHGRVARGPYRRRPGDGRPLSPPVKS